MTRFDGVDMIGVSRFPHGGVGTTDEGPTDSSAIQTTGVPDNGFEPNNTKGPEDSQRVPNTYILMNVPQNIYPFQHRGPRPTPIKSHIILRTSQHRD